MTAIIIIIISCTGKEFHFGERDTAPAKPKRDWSSLSQEYTTEDNQVRFFIIFTKLSSSIFFGLKGTGRVVSSDPPYKVDNALFITVPLKALSDHILIIYQCL